MKHPVLGAFAAVCFSGCGGGDDAVRAEAAGLRARAPAAPAATSPMTAELLLNYAEATYPQYLPGRKATQTSAPFVYRHYPETGVYVGVVVGSSSTFAADGVYVLGGPFGAVPVHVGRVSDFIGPPDPYEGYAGHPGAGYPAAAAGGGPTAR